MIKKCQSRQCSQCVLENFSSSAATKGFSIKISSATFISAAALAKRPSFEFSSNFTAGLSSSFSSRIAKEGTDSAAKPFFFWYSVCLAVCGSFSSIFIMVIASKFILDRLPSSNVASSIEVKNFLKRKPTSARYNSYRKHAKNTGHGAHQSLAICSLRLVESNQFLMEARKCKKNIDLNTKIILNSWRDEGVNALNF
uniref:Uncharacterized protein n=1 Tax=Glossina austeni TaxID=7395 RepID=A0A1A9UIZ9_GLOAU